jgi:hypothetical protein
MNPGQAAADGLYKYLVTFVQSVEVLLTKFGTLSDTRHDSDQTQQRCRPEFSIGKNLSMYLTSLLPQLESLCRIQPDQRNTKLVVLLVVLTLKFCTLLSSASQANTSLAYAAVMANDADLRLLSEVVVPRQFKKLMEKL